MLLFATCATGAAIAFVAVLIVFYRVVCPVWIDREAVSAFKAAAEDRRASTNEAA